MTHTIELNTAALTYLQQFYESLKTRPDGGAELQRWQAKADSEAYMFTYTVLRLNPELVKKDDEK